MPEIYVSVDIEADGPIPGDYSMISLGSAAFDESGKLIDTFQRNLYTLAGASQHPDTMTWWETQPEAWKAAREDRQLPATVMGIYSAWLKGLPGKPVFVGYPATYDFMFVHWYLIHFLDYSPFGFQGIDLKTYAMAYMGTPFKATVKRSMPESWNLNDDVHSHIAWEDALGQGKMFFKIRDSLKRLRTGPSEDIPDWELAGDGNPY